VALYVDEKTELPESEWYVSAHDQKVKKTIGKQNLDFMIQKLNANAQPYYTLVDNKGSLLSAPKGYDLNVENFVEFLDNGIQEFQGRQGNNMASSRIIQRQNE
jgi:thiol:disulfide interchange protein DsbD